MKRSQRSGLFSACLVTVQLIGASPVAAQPTRDRARELLRDADAAIGRETITSAQEAIRLSRGALTLIALRGSTPPSASAPALDRFIAGRAFLFTGMGHRILGNVDSTLHYVRRSIPLARGVEDASGEALALTELGTTLAGIGQLDSGVVSLRRSLALAQARLEAREQLPILLKYGVLLGRTGERDSARVVLVKAAQLAATLKDALAFAHAHRFLAAGYSNAGQLDSALALYRVAQQVLGALRDTASLSAVHSELAELFHRLNVLDSALAYSGYAIDVQRSRSMFAALMTSFRGRAIIFSRTLQYDSAIANEREALVLARRLRNIEVETALESELGMNFAKSQPDSALVYARRAQGRQGAANATSRIYASIALATAHTGLKQLDSALVHGRAAAAMPRAGLSPEMLFQVIGVNAVVHYAAGNYGASAAYADTATALHSRSGRNTGSDFFRVAFGDNDAKIFKMWTNSWVRLQPTLGDRAVFAALAASERGRAQALLDLMTDSSRVVAPGSDLAAEGRQLVAQALRSADVVVSYETFDDAIAVWTLAKSGAVEMQIMPISPDSLTMAIGAFRAHLGVDRASRALTVRGDDLETGAVAGAAAAGGDWRAAGRRLRQMLLPVSVDSLLTKGRQIVIIPAGTIAVVPFAALPDASGDGVLSDVVAIRYAPSITALVVAESQAKPTNATVLIVSNPTMPQATNASGSRVQLGPLPGAEAEGAAVARRFERDPYTGARATETSVRLLLPIARVIHIASHGYAYSSEAQARSSFIALAPDAKNDGLLTVGEILDDRASRLIADLVTLSACQTGLGNLRDTEGTIGLQRAFLGRGARSVLVSLWSVSDDATRMLMDRFYAHWLDDRDKPDKAESLRRAQTDVKKKAEFSAPRFWAAFQVVGAR